MSEPLYAAIGKVGQIMHWLGKQAEAEALIAIAKDLYERGVRDQNQLESWIASKEIGEKP